MKMLQLALRNLLRNRRRSIATLLAMMIGLDAILLFGGYSGNVITSMQVGYVQQRGHLQIQYKDYFLYGSGNPAAYGIPDYQRIIDTVRKDPELAPMLTMVTPTLQIGGIAGNFAAGVSKTVIGFGVVVPEQNKMREWTDYGNVNFTKPLSLTGTSSDSAIIGTGVARMLQLCQPLKVSNCPQVPVTETPNAGAKDAPADIAALSDLETPAAGPKTDSTQIEILAANDHGVPNVSALKVVMAENQGLKEFDDIYLAMHLSQAQHLIYGKATPKVTAIQIQLQHTDQIPAARARIEALLKSQFKTIPLELLDYETLTPIYRQTIDFFNSIFGFIACLIGVIVLFTVGNTMSMAVVERTVEIGTLRAVGQRRNGIRLIFVCEGMLLGVAGALLGVTSALLIATAINLSGMSWTPPGYVAAYPLQVRVWGDWGLIFGSTIGLTVVAIASAWWPANRASKLNIVDALRHV